MDGWWIALTAALAIFAGWLLLKLVLLRRALRETAEELEEKLRLDTNTQITLSTGDQAARALAAQINVQLRALRKERLRLQQGDHALQEAVTDLSHDLRTPLTAICGYLDLLEQEPHTENARHYLAVIRERTGAMRAMTQELLQYSVVSSTADALTRQAVCVNSVLEQSLAGFYGVLSARGITPKIELPEAPVVRQLDAAALRRVFDNILSNAAKYTDGDLSVRLPPDGRVTISNRTQKLDRVQAGRLFDRFYTVEAASGSTGLGLSIAKLLTEKMGGRISAAYENETLQVFVDFPQ